MGGQVWCISVTRDITINHLCYFFLQIVKLLLLRIYVNATPVKDGSSRKSW